jgi:FkbM family methyltransferase
LKKYNVIVATDIGSFIINKNDLGVGWQLSEYGTYDPAELQSVRGLMQILKQKNPNLVALDVGANIGVHSIVLSQEVGERGIVYAFEAQRIIFNMLAGNIALNSVGNVFCFHNAVSDVSELINIPIFDYGSPLSFGSVEFGGVQKENIGQVPQSGIPEQVLGLVIDEMNFSRMDFLKIDVEGMEMKVLKGAEKSINKFRPFILIEYLKSDKDAMVTWLKETDYIIYSGIGANFLAIPKETGIEISDLTLVS